MKLSLSSGAQVVTRHGQAAVVVLAADEYERLTAPRSNLAAFFASAPRADLVIERDPGEGREPKL